MLLIYRQLIKTITCKEVTVMKTDGTTVETLWGAQTAEKVAEKKKVSIIDIMVASPLALLGVTIAAFPISLPILYVVALLFMD